MCYICSCFGWILDFIQRGITFLLTCWLGCVLLLGMVVSCGAGIAYGYNYCMAEFLTFGKSDVTVYMRRGQFGKGPVGSGEEADTLPDVKPKSRRRNDFEGDDNPLNSTTDYDEEPLDKPKPLAKSWRKADDTRQYAEKLTKYADRPDTADQEVQADVPTTAAGYYLLTSPPKRRITVDPNNIIDTTVWKSGSSEIVMRRFQPQEPDVDSDVTTPSHLRNIEGVREHDEFFYRLAHTPTKTTYNDDYRATVPQVDMRVADRKQAPYRYVPMRHWGVTTSETPVIPDDLVTDQSDEESAN